MKNSKMGTWKCEICSIKFDRYACKGKNGVNPKYCSRECTGQGLQRIMKDKHKILSKAISKEHMKNETTRSCLYCDTVFLVLPNNKKKQYCSRGCALRHRNTGLTDKGITQVMTVGLPKKIVPEQLKNAQFISKENTESTVTVNKSDVYKIKCKTCDQIVVRYLSRGKPVPRFCSKKCLHWLGDMDRKPVDTSSHWVNTYAKTVSIFDHKIILMLSMTLVNIGMCIYFVLKMS